MRVLVKGDLAEEFALKLQLSEKEAELQRERAEKEKERAEKERAEKEKERKEVELQKERSRRLEAEKSTLMAYLDRVLSSTEQVFARGDDLMCEAFDSGEVVDFWFRDVARCCWEGPWSEFANTDPKKGESKVIQPAIIERFRYPQGASPYTLKHTNTGWNKLTHDAMLVLKGYPVVEMSVALLLEWVGQDEKGFPSKKHKAKIVQDCVRLSKRCGGRTVFAVVSDLSRIVVLRYMGMSPERGMPIIQRTKVLIDVQEVLECFAGADPRDLGVQDVLVAFPNGEKRFARVRLGSGLHATVYESVCIGKRQEKYFLKCFRSIIHCKKEVDNLKVLEECGVTQVPRVSLLSVDKLAFEGRPVGTKVEAFRCNVIIFDIAAQLVRVLQAAHEAGLCHRDVRPSNIVIHNQKVRVSSGMMVSFSLCIGGPYLLFALLNRMCCASISNACAAGRMSPSQPVLIDWASACPVASVQRMYSGTTHYAATEVLENLKANKEYAASRKHDLESLCLSVFDLCCHINMRPGAVTLPKSEYKTIQAHWVVTVQQNVELASVIELARRGDYNGLYKAFLSKSFGHHEIQVVPDRSS